MDLPIDSFAKRDNAKRAKTKRRETISFFFEKCLICISQFYHSHHLLNRRYNNSPIHTLTNTFRGYIFKFH